MTAPPPNVVPKELFEILDELRALHRAGLAKARADERLIRLLADEIEIETLISGQPPRLLAPAEYRTLTNVHEGGSL